MPTLILFFDGYCPLCVNEVRHLRRLDRRGALRFEDIQHPDFAKHWPQIDKTEASRILLGLDNGTLIKGLDVTHRAWSLVGRGWLTAPLRWPLLRGLADRLYLWFAANRYRVSGWLLPGAGCTDGRCQPPRRPEK
ncbi:thiol-disulfide oxidoreductase DCC family protein [Gallaecimonas pentaromativorans]|uniref:Putative DCC family thiol-disulfide oxidoreductase YuxK n=1 Tax=Gallaecimonas pentaromativorans TaxID=584787 RepID=A0A3N1PGQ7_9GAMM|nr:DUF393 domain-containing protein [Gallaecimonas pentaromativorans]ROQ30642.1 putative DCC family thiol-disulfide oxidoreductase YuxK [Gallaecimonas pentaromativorans]